MTKSRIYRPPHQRPRIPCSRLRCYVLAFVAILLCPIPINAQNSDPAPVTYDYVTQPGDTCLKISTQQFGDNGRYHLIHHHNPWLRDLPLPHRFKPGTVLKLPFSPIGPDGPDAELTAMQRRVEARSPIDELWKLAQLGLELFRGWQISTAEKSAAEITFRDESTLNIRENTLVILFGPQKQATKTLQSTARLDKGALRSRLDALAGQPKVTVVTPSAIATLREGEAVVSTDSENMCRVSNFAGKPVLLSSAEKPQTVTVSSGYGSRVAQGKRPEKPRPLPPTPRWLKNEPGLVLGLEGLGASLSGNWEKVAGAIGYRVEIARRSDGGDVILAAFVQGDIDRFEAFGLPTGWYFISVSAIDALGLESRPSLRHATLVRLARPAPTDALRDHWPTVGLPETTTHLATAPRILIGAMLLFPDGILCDLGDNRWSSTLVLTASGVTELRCRDIEHNTAEPLVIDVVSPTVSAIPATDNGELLVTRGLSHEIPLLFDSPVALPASVQVLGPPGVELSIDRSETGLPKSVWIKADAHVPSPFTLDIVVQNDADTARLATFFVKAQTPEAPVSLTTAATPQKPPRPSHLVDHSVSSLLLGARDLESSNHLAWLTIGVLTKGPSDYQEAVTMAFGAQLSLLDNQLRLGLGHNFQFADGLKTHSTLRQANRLRTDISGIFPLTDTLWVSAGLTGWLPTFADHDGNRVVTLAPNAELQTRLANRLIIRTRQGFAADLTEDGHRFWAASVAVDAWIWGPLGIGVEFTSNLGTIGGDLQWIGTLTPSFYVDTGVILASLGPLVALNDESRKPFGNVSLLFSGGIAF